MLPNNITASIGIAQLKKIDLLEKEKRYMEFISMNYVTQLNNLKMLTIVVINILILHIVFRLIKEMSYQNIYIKESIQL